MSGIIRKIDDLGRIVIPRELRHQLGIKEGDAFEVSLGERGTIVLKKQIAIQDVSGEIDRIKDVMLDNETTADIREEVFRHLNAVEELVNSVNE